MSFLQRLKGAGVEDDALKDVNKEESEDSLKGVIQLDIDLIESGDSIVIFAPVAGAVTKDIQVSVEGDNDVVVIKGERNRPEDFLSSNQSPNPANSPAPTEEGSRKPMETLQQMHQGISGSEAGNEEAGEEEHQIAIKDETKKEEGEETGEKYYAEDIKWGEFYRKIILPEAIDVSNTEVKIRNGILMLKLPILRRSNPQKHVLEIQKAE